MPHLPWKCCCHSPRASLNPGQALWRPELVLWSWVCSCSWIGFLTKAFNQKLNASANSKEWIHALARSQPVPSTCSPHLQFKASKSIMKFSWAVLDTALSSEQIQNFQFCSKLCGKLVLQAPAPGECVSAKYPEMLRYHLSHSRHYQIPFLQGWRSPKSRVAL